MMDRERRYTLRGFVIIMALIALADRSISIENPILPLFAILVAVVLLQLRKKKVTEAMEDERIYRISEKASRRALQVFAVTAMVTGAVLRALSSEYPGFSQAGFTLMYSAAALVMLYVIFYGYYSTRDLE